MVGLGAMGGGMARSLLRSTSIDLVAGFDLSLDLVNNFFAEAKEAGKGTSELPKELKLENFVTAYL